MAQELIVREKRLNQKQADEAHKIETNATQPAVLVESDLAELFGRPEQEEEWFTEEARVYFESGVEGEANLKVIHGLAQIFAMSKKYRGLAMNLGRVEEQKAIELQKPGFIGAVKMIKEMGGALVRPLFPYADGTQWVPGYYGFESESGSGIIIIDNEASPSGPKSSEELDEIVVQIQKQRSGKLLDSLTNELTILPNLVDIEQEIEQYKSTSGGRFTLTAIIHKKAQKLADPVAVNPPPAVPDKGGEHITGANPFFAADASRITILPGALKSVHNSN